MGFKHGQHRNYSEDIPLANLFVTIVNKVGVETEKFADSNGEITDLIGQSAFEITL